MPWRGLATNVSIPLTETDMYMHGGVEMNGGLHCIVAGAVQYGKHVTVPAVRPAAAKQTTPRARPCTDHKYLPSIDGNRH